MWSPVSIFATNQGKYLSVKFLRLVSAAVKVLTWILGRSDIRECEAKHPKS